MIIEIESHVDEEFQKDLNVLMKLLAAKHGIDYDIDSRSKDEIFAEFFIAEVEKNKNENVYVLPWGLKPIFSVDTLKDYATLDLIFEYAKAHINAGYIKHSDRYIWELIRRSIYHQTEEVINFDDVKVPADIETASTEIVGITNTNDDTVVCFGRPGNKYLMEGMTQQESAIMEIVTKKINNKQQ